MEKLGKCNETNEPFGDRAGNKVEIVIKWEIGGATMKLKDQLILREVAGEYVIVPTGQRVREVTNVVCISSSAAYLWDYMKDHEFTKEDLIQRILEHYQGVTRDQAEKDIDRFLKVLSDNSVLDNGVILGNSLVKTPREVLDKLWPKGTKLKRMDEKGEV